jgi:hypothetical protein
MDKSDFKVGDKVICKAFFNDGKQYNTNNRPGRIIYKKKDDFVVDFGNCFRLHFSSSEMEKIG